MGDVLGRYQIEERIGTGAMGTVYRARHIKLARRVAIKVLHGELSSDANLRKRFEREAELAGKLDHPNVISILDFGETETGLYLVMDFADGPSLGSLMTGEPLPRARVIPIVRQLCTGLEHAHNHGLVHRDFKPDNVIVEAGDHVRIVDFGIATLRGDTAEKLTQVGVVLGTPQYMAPEYVTGGTIDHRIDLFALGVVVYELVCGKLPFDGDGVDVARANLLEPIPAMRDRAPIVEVDPLLEAFARRLLEKAPDDRAPSAFAARLMLDAIERDRHAAAQLLGLARATTGETAPSPEVAATIVSLPPVPSTIRTPMPLPRGLRKRALPWLVAGAALAVGGALALSQCHAAAAPAINKSDARHQRSIDLSRTTDENHRRALADSRARIDQFLASPASTASAGAAQ